MDALLSEISKYPNGTKLIICWSNGLKINGEIDTIYETDNGLEMEEDKYFEYYACAFRVLAILNFSKKKPKFRVNELIEVSMQDAPFRVTLENETVVWEKKRFKL